MIAAGATRPTATSRTTRDPLYATKGGWAHLYEPEERLDADMALGPYPGEEVAVTLTVAGGTKASFTARR